jgi:hypothetical protein
MRKYTSQIIIFLAFILICWTGCAITSSSKAIDSMQKKENIRKLIKISGNADSILQLSTIPYDNQMTLIIQRMRPDLSKMIIKKLRQELRAEIERNIQDQGGLMDYIISIYNAHFTHQEIRDWLLFYESPLGKKINSTMPSVMEDSKLAYEQPVMYEWLKERLKKEGITIP